MVNEGIYYSRMLDREFMWAFMHKGKEYPAHFARRTITTVSTIFLTNDLTDYLYVDSVEKYLVIPKDILVWKDQ